MGLRETTNNEHVFFAKAKNTRAHARDLGAIYWSIADTLSANLNQKRPVLADCEPNEYTYLSCTGTHSHADVSHPGEHFEVGLSAHTYIFAWLTHISYVPGLRLSLVVVFVCIRVLKLMCSHPAASAEGRRGFFNMFFYPPTLKSPS